MRNNASNSKQETTARQKLMGFGQRTESPAIDQQASRLNVETTIGGSLETGDFRGLFLSTAPKIGEKLLGLSCLRRSLSAFMGAGDEAPRKNTSGFGFTLTRSGLKAENQNHSFFPKGAAAPGPRFETNRDSSQQIDNTEKIRTTAR